MVTHKQMQVLEYWNNAEVESMYDKHLLNAEIELIKQRIPINAKVLDAGCGEGEGTVVYSSLAGVIIHAVDFSETRLLKAKQRLGDRKNVTLGHVDFLESYKLDNDYDIVISQRLLINLLEWQLQQNVLLDLMSLLKPGGKLLMLEGSQQGVDSLNRFRAAWKMRPLPVKWHNLFLNDDVLSEFMRSHGYALLEQAGLGTYFLLTRGVRPALDKTLDWDCEFNRLAAQYETEQLLDLDLKFSRLKLWVFQK